MQRAGLPNSHLRTQSNAMKNLELSMHNTEAREEALAGNAASLDLPPQPRARGISSYLGLYHLGLGNNQLKEATGTPEMRPVLPIKQVYNMLLASGLCYFFLIKKSSRLIDLCFSPILSA